jgi:N-acetylmuramoyl-L-alanine amidase CwlA
MDSHRFKVPTCRKGIYPMMNRLWIMSGLVTALSLFAGGYWTGKRSPAYDTKTVETTRSSAIDRKLERDEQRHVTIVQDKTVKLPNGTVVITKTTTKDESVTETVQAEHALTKETSVTKIDNRRDWRVSVFMPPTWPVTSYSDISVEVSRRVLGPVSVAAQVSGRGALLIGVGVEF